MKTKIKSTLAKFLCVALILALVPVIPAQAAGTGMLSITSQTASPGSDVTITVQMTENPGIAALAFELAWDIKSLTLKSFDKSGSVIANYPSDNSTEKIPNINLATQSTYFLECSNDTATENYTATGKVVSLTFTVNPSHSGGAETLKLTIPKGYIVDHEMKEVPFNATDGTINVVKPLAGAVAVTLAAPVLDGTPVTSVSGTGYSGTVSWSPALTAETSFRFAPNTVYTAAVSLSPVNSAFNPFANPSTITINGDTPTSTTINSAASIVFTKVFPSTANRIKTDVSDKISFTGGTFDYDRSVKSIPDALIDGSVTGGSFTYTGDNRSQTNAGVYSSTAVYDSPTAHGEKTVNWTINKAALTVSGAMAVSRAYDGTRNIAISGATLIGVLDGDAVTIGLIEGSAATADAGTDKDVNVSLTLDGANKNNYSVTAPANIKVTVSPAEPIYSVPAAKNIKVGSALAVYTAIAPNNATGVGDEAVAGNVSWYSDSEYTVPAAESDVNGKIAGQNITLYWRFTSASANYTAKQGETVFTIASGDAQPMAFASASVVKTYGDATFINAATHTSSANDAANGGIGTRGTITYSSDTPSVATVDETTGAVTVIAPGSAVITARAAAVPGKWAEDSAVYTLTVNKKAPALSDLTFSLAGAVYSGGPQGIPAPTSGINGFGAIAVRYNGSENLPIDAGTYTVTALIAEGALYSAATLVLGGYTISPKQISITGATLSAKTYDGTRRVTVGAVTFSDTPASYDAVAEFATASAGSAKPVTVTVTLRDGNYRLASAAYTTTATIGKAQTTGVSKTLQVTKNSAREYPFDLTALLPALSAPKELGVVGYTVSAVSDTGNILAVRPGGSVVSPFAISVVSTNLSATATISLRISSANYADFTAVITVQTVDKSPVTISGVTLANKSYNAAPYSFAATPVLTITATGERVTGVTLESLYESTDGGGYRSVSAPVNAGAYKLTLSIPAANPLYTGSGVFMFVITPATVTVTAEDKAIVKGGALPSYSYVQSPAVLFGTDVWTSLPSAGCPSADANVTGAYPIVVAGGSLGANYSVVYVNGTLTVSASSNANLSGLSLSSGTLVPDFSPDVTVYTVSVLNGVSGVTVSAVAADADATVSGAGIYSLLVGSNVIYVVVTAQDGRTTRVYGITVVRAAGTGGGGVSNGNGNGSGSIGSGGSGSGSIPGATSTVTEGQTPIAPSPSGTTPAGISQTQPTQPTQPTPTLPKSLTPFADAGSVSGWAVDYFDKLLINGMMTGYPDDTIRPKANVTRAEFTKLIVTASGITINNGNTMQSYSDVKAGDWFKVFVDIASSHNLINGIGGGFFAPSAPISRQDLCAIAYRALLARNVALPTDRGAAFTDDNLIADYAKDAIYALRQMGVISGRDTGVFDPAALATREETAKIIYVLMEFVN